jgi:hypothetical protein
LVNDLAVLLINKVILFEIISWVLGSGEINTLYEGAHINGPNDSLFPNKVNDTSLIACIV